MNSADSTMKKNQILSQRTFQDRFSILMFLIGGLIFLGSRDYANGQMNGNKGLRPYELDWAGRFADDHMPLVDFEDMKGWTVSSNRGSAEIGRSQEQMIWGSSTCKIAFKGDPAGADFVLSPPQPLKISNSFTSANMWVWCDYDRAKYSELSMDSINKIIPRLSLLLQTSDGIMILQILPAKHNHCNPSPDL